MEFRCFETQPCKELRRRMSATNSGWDSLVPYWLLAWSLGCLNTAFSVSHNPIHCLATGRCTSLEQNGRLVVRANHQLKALGDVVLAALPAKLRHPGKQKAASRVQRLQLIVPSLQDHWASPNQKLINLLVVVIETATFGGSKLVPKTELPLQKSQLTGGFH